MTCIIYVWMEPGQYKSILRGDCRFLLFLHVLSRNGNVCFTFHTYDKYQTRIMRTCDSKYRISYVWKTWRFGLVGNVVGRINEVNQRRARLILGWVTVFKTDKPSLYVTSHPGELSLAIPSRVGKMSTGDDYGHRQGRNGEFCVTVGSVTRIADILTQSVIWRTWAVC